MHGAAAANDAAAARHTRGGADASAASPSSHASAASVGASHFACAVLRTHADAAGGGDGGAHCVALRAARRAKRAVRVCGVLVVRAPGDAAYQVRVDEWSNVAPVAHLADGFEHGSSRSGNDADGVGSGDVDSLESGASLAAEWARVRAATFTAAPALVPHGCVYSVRGRVVALAHADGRVCGALVARDTVDAANLQPPPLVLVLATTADVQTALDAPEPPTIVDRDAHTNRPIHFCAVAHARTAHVAVHVLLESCGAAAAAAGDGNGDAQARVSVAVAVRPPRVDAV